MKLRIEFENKEREAFFKALDLKGNKDESEYAKGRFGMFKYDSKNNIIEADIKSSCIIGYTKLLSTFIGFIKSIMSTFEMFADNWFDELEISHGEEAEKNIREGEGLSSSPLNDKTSELLETINKE